MRRNFRLVKKSHGYVISSILDGTVQFFAQILARKITRKCRIDEVLAPIAYLDVQCTKGVQYNWDQYLCHEFLEDFWEAQDDGKTFHYAWLLLLIMPVAWRMSEEIQFPRHDPDLCEAMKFTSLWEVKDPKWVMETKIFFFLFESELRMVINQQPWLSPRLHA